MGHGLKAIVCAVVLVVAPGSVLADSSVSHRDAFRFLNQASFGPTESSVAALVALGDAESAYGRWIDEQVRAPASLQLPATQAAPAAKLSARRSKWFEDAINGPDQLRQRVAFALSQILVVSEYGPLRRSPLAVASYSDTLVADSFLPFSRTSSCRRSCAGSG